MSRSSEITHPSSNVDSDVLIKVGNVSKKFCRDFKKSLYYGLKDTARDIFHPQHKSQDASLRPSEFWANQDISFEVKRGECMGLIGLNGAGKTTLLKMLNGLIKPDTGSIEMRGRVGALIALGAGFNPILTGRENIYVNGSILGLQKKEIDAKLGDIVDFAEIEDAIDAPVRTYSSGMQVRLGFAVATALNPDILLIDEVLAVGDFRFRQKSIARIQKFLSHGGSAIFISHNLAQVQTVCQTAIYLEYGKIISCGDVKDVARAYLDGDIATADSTNSPIKGNIATVTRLLNESGETAICGEECHFEICIESHKKIENIEINIVVLSQDQGVRLFSLGRGNDSDFSIKSGLNKIVCRLDQCPLLPGCYAVRLNIVRTSDKFVIFNKGADDSPDFIEVRASGKHPTEMEEALGELMYVTGKWS